MKYVAYYRVSTNKQSLGIEAQKNAVQSFLSSNNDSVLLSCFEEKESGKNDCRIELNKALSLCKKENATLLIAKLDRLSRKVSFLFNLRDSGIDFLSLDCPNFSTLTLGIYATLAQTERELISNRTILALQELKKQGAKLGAPNAHLTNEAREKAYQVRKDNARNNPNNKKAALLVEALLHQGYNKAQIARKLNENGFLTSQNCQFNPSQVFRIITLFNLQPTKKEAN